MADCKNDDCETNGRSTLSKVGVSVAFAAVFACFATGVFYAANNANKTKKSTSKLVWWGGVSLALVVGLILTMMGVHHFAFKTNPICKDECGVCGGPGKSADGCCPDEPKDECGVCGGPGKSADGCCPDDAECEVCGPSQAKDECGVCGDPAKMPTAAAPISPRTSAACAVAQAKTPTAAARA